MKSSLARPFVCFLLLFLVMGAGTAAHGSDAVSFNPLPVLIEASAAGGGGVPVGTVVAWPVATNPSDADSWLECNGQSTAGYPELAAVVGANVPNYQGVFLRGLGGNSAGLGVQQGDAIRNITGSFESHSAGFAGGFIGLRVSGSFAIGKSTPSRVLRFYEAGPGNFVNFDASNAVPTASENRPVNMAVRYLIRARP